MFAFLTKPKAVTAIVNDVAINVQPKETLLQSALRQGISFPHSCRVGGCSTCKCKLVEGKVKELTQFGYILSDDELDQGYVLACQSVPLTNVKIEVDMGRSGARRKVCGRVIAQEKLAHDILRLRVQLDEALPYKAGQFAHLTIGELPGISRSYSFASPVRPDAQVSFFVRKVPGGELSSRIHDRSLMGLSVTLEGPLGDFWLRPANTPILMVAGGSGLAPVLAMLEDALASNVNRPVTLLFGARTQQDIYALDAISKVKQKWRSHFDFVPVLSEEPEVSNWIGLRGMVTAALADHVLPDSHVYLCGPPQMVDGACKQLLKIGVPVAHIHTDRFTTQYDVAGTV